MKIFLEIKSISITRLKHDLAHNIPAQSLPLKSKVSRLRDWNRERSLCVFLRDALLEIKSISITRLKRSGCCLLCHLSNNHLKSKVSRLRDWNAESEREVLSAPTLEIKSISITRLKLAISNRSPSTSTYLKSKVSRLRDWNTKEDIPERPWEYTWNQKYLDYEIETREMASILIFTAHLKSKVSRLRDWNSACGKDITTHANLKSKVSRLRDWNMWHYTFVYIPQAKLEIKSISITRLKLYRGCSDRI